MFAVLGCLDHARATPTAAPPWPPTVVTVTMPTGNLRPSSSVMARYRPPIARTRLRIG